jgi:hypothetical protein
MQGSFLLLFVSRIPWIPDDDKVQVKKNQNIRFGSTLKGLGIRG